MVCWGHADQSLAYGIKRAGQLGYKWVELCLLDGRCPLSNGSDCHVTSMDTDPKIIRDLCEEAGVRISGPAPILTKCLKLSSTKWSTCMPRSRDFGRKASCAGVKLRVFVR
jgi:hypothetical protein